MNVQLLTFKGCPQAEPARANLRAALREAAAGTEFTEVDLMGPETPPSLTAYPSPTVLVDGVDIMGEAGRPAALSCRSSGAPSISAIVAAIEAAMPALDP